MSKFKKTINDLIKNLEDHLYLLDESIIRCKENSAQYINMAGELRVLLNKGKDHEDLLIYLAELLNAKLEIILYGPSYGPSIEGKKISFNKYLHNKDIFLDGELYSRLAFIKLMCNKSGNFLHIHKTIDTNVLLGENLVLFDRNANNWQLLEIAQYTSSVAHYLLEFIKKMPQEELEIFNINFIKN